MKKFITAVLCLAVLFSFSACKGQDNSAVKGQGNELWTEASPETSAMEFYSFDGESGSSGFLFDQAQEKQILSELSEARAEPVSDWTPEQFRYPAYGLWIGTKDGMGIQAVWSNGYLLLRDGSVYEFDYDFAALEDAYTWEHARDIVATAELPCGYFLTLWDGQWYPEQMSKAAEKTPEAEIGMELVEQTEEGLSVLLRNDSDEEWLFGEYFSLEVQLDGEWYVVPTTPEQNWGFNDIGYLLSPGENREMSYHLMMYGTLPAGDYRLVVEGITAEFCVQGA